MNGELRELVCEVDRKFQDELKISVQCMGVGKMCKSGIQKFYVKPAIPILFFGDLDAYEDSDKKIITVGLNPSNKEFPKSSKDCKEYVWIDEFVRFPECREIADYINAENIETYLISLSNYFKTCPYSNWFNCYEPLLNGMEASYYPSSILKLNGKIKKSTALHTDICSPFATSPTWNGLCKCQLNHLSDTGHKYWNQLVDVLQPDYIIISVNKKYLAHVGFEVVRVGEVIFTKPPKPSELPVLGKPEYTAVKSQLRLSPEKCTDFVTVSGGVLPCQMFNSDEKFNIGQTILSHEWPKS